MLIKTTSPKIHLVIPDSHALPGYDNRRYDYIGHLINDIRPDVVVDIGDWFDMASLCSYDKGKKSFEGRRYHKDIEAGVEAQDRVKTIVDRQKRKRPRYIRTLGNHENRIQKLINISPEYDGLISLDDLLSKEYNWEQYDFNTPVEVDGIHYCHSFPSGAMGKPIGGENIGRMLIQKKHVSCTQGHSHLLDYAVRSTIDGRKISGLSVGCYLDYTPDFAASTSHLWDRGVVIKTQVEDGCYDFRFVSLRALEEEYGAL